MKVDDGLPGGQEASPHVVDVVGMCDTRPVCQEKVEEQAVGVDAPLGPDGDSSRLFLFLDSGLLFTDLMILPRDFKIVLTPLPLAARLLIGGPRGRYHRLFGRSLR